jgi:hypothetical protein
MASTLSSARDFSEHHPLPSAKTRAQPEELRQRGLDVADKNSPSGLRLPSWATPDKGPSDGVLSPKPPPPAVETK